MDPWNLYGPESSYEYLTKLNSHEIEKRKRKRGIYSINIYCKSISYITRKTVQPLSR